MSPKLENHTNCLLGVLHRNEASGALSGLTRVRKFQQDDTHIFCTQEQIMSEIEGLFDFLQSIYGLFGFTFKLKLSTRPEKYLGSLDTWDYAEDQLKKAMTKFKGNDWIIDEGDGAFYGPKIDITIADALQVNIVFLQYYCGLGEANPRSRVIT